MKTKKQYALICILIFIGIFLYFINIPIPCLFHKITKLYCPGCGITRMFVSIIKLDIVSAFKYNQFVFILLVLYIILIMFRFITKKDLRISKKIIYIIVICSVIFGILRNIPIFHWLQP